MRDSRLDPHRALLTAAVAVLVSAGGIHAESGGWAVAEPGYAWSFPEDHRAHPEYRTEWWYLTGTLRDDDGARYGYQFTLFRVGLTRAPRGEGSAWRAGQLVMGHAALTEIDAGRHRFSETLHRTSPLLAGLGSEPDPLLAWVRAPAGSAGRWSVAWNGDGFDLTMTDAARGFGFELRATASHPPVLQGDRGFSRKSADGSSASQYYSFTRLETSGTLVVDGTSRAVRGTSWMDKEFSTSHLAADQVGWDWFSLRFDDGRDLMLYRLRRADGSTSYAGATLVDRRSGEQRALAADAWSVEPLERWTARDAAVEYPVVWRLRAPAAGIDAIVTPYVRAAENVSDTAAGLRYWEGPVRVDAVAGGRLGEGYVELTGYGAGNRPPV